MYEAKTSFNAIDGRHFYQGQEIEQIEYDRLPMQDRLLFRKKDKREEGSSDYASDSDTTTSSWGAVFSADDSPSYSTHSSFEGFEGGDGGGAGASGGYGSGGYDSGGGDSGGSDGGGGSD